ncbi:G-protein coupled receptor 151 [Syngnathus acus]|uniref:G-protein coupled receptor 151 n=1 Tax=Syngnathus acus TaxID=161584 RepID=UPI001885FCA8|nr:G-protein coupled receptor 151 [Syngnathus acus]
MDSDPNGTLVDFAGGVQLLEGEDIRTAVPALLVGMCVSGAAGNLLVLLVFARDFRAGQGSEAKALLASVAATDALLLVLCAPVRALAAYKQAWVLGRFACATADWFQHACLVAKTLLLAVSTRAKHTSEGGAAAHCGWILWAVALVWLLSMMLPIPQMLFSALQPRGAHDVVCVSQMPACASRFMAVFYKIYPTATYVAPVLFTVAYYTKSLHRALNYAPNPRRLSKVTLVLLCLSTTLGLMLLPEWGTFTWVRLGYHKPPAGVLLCAQVLVYACGALSPVLLVTMYDDVRRGLVALCMAAACRGAKAPGASKTTEGNGAELGGAGANAVLANAEKTFPDVEHFWTGRRNTQVEEEQDPIPWEKEEKML